MKAKHLLIAGDSGGGKTTRARETVAKHDGIAVCVNHDTGEDGKTDFEDFPGQAVTSLEEMQAAVQDCRNRAEVRNLRLDLRVDDVLEGASMARKFARQVGQHFDAEICTLVLIDEGHNALPDSESKSSVNSGNPVAKMLHEDRDLNVKCVIVTQDPQDLYYPPIKQCKHIVWVGAVSTFHKGFIQFYNLNEMVAGDGVENADLPTEDHEVVIIKPTHPPRVVHRTETKARYG